MTSAELKSLIEADQTAKAFADAGNDTAAAERASAIASAVTVQTFATYRTVMGLVSLAAAGQLSRSLQMLIQAGPGQSLNADAIAGLVKADKYLDGETGLDVSSPQTQGLLDMIVAAGLPLSAENAAAIKALSSKPQTVTANQVSEAWASYRPDGKVVG